MAPQFLAELCDGARKLKPKIGGRILARLIEAEWIASDAWARDDYRIAYLTVLYASRGDRSPHVTATYKVLGLHPDKVHGAVISRRKAQLGKFYELWNLPPKKSVESVRPAKQVEQRRVVGEEPYRPEKPNGAEVRFGATWKPLSGKPARTVPGIETMASTQTSYREPVAQTSAKNQGFVSRSQIEAMILSADLSVETQAQIRTKGARTRPGVRRYRRDHLNRSLFGMWKVAEPYGKNRIELFASVAKCHVLANRCERQYRYNLRALEKTGVIRLVHQANSHNTAGTFRHTATHELNLDALRQRCRKLPVPIKPESNPHPPQEPKPEAPKPATVAASSQSTTNNHRPPRQLTPREGRDLVKELTTRMKGVAGEINTRDGLMYVGKDDPRYRAPMSQESALVSACMALGIPYEAAVNHLKLCRWKFDPGEKT